MTTRLATAQDSKQIVDFLEHYHVSGSNLSDIPFSRSSMFKVTEYYIGMPRHVCFVHTSDGKITGVLMASIEPFMFNQKRFWATDLLNVAESGGAWLLKRFFAWAKMYKVDRIFMGVSTGNPLSNALYAHMGMEELGGMFGFTPQKDEP
jgi:hypothetical protein